MTGSVGATDGVGVASPSVGTVDGSGLAVGVGDAVGVGTALGTGVTGAGVIGTGVGVGVLSSPDPMTPPAPPK